MLLSEINVVFCKLGEYTREYSLVMVTFLLAVVVVSQYLEICVCFSGSRNLLIGICAYFQLCPISLFIDITLSSSSYPNTPFPFLILILSDQFFILLMHQSSFLRHRFFFLPASMLFPHISYFLRIPLSFFPPPYSFLYVLLSFSRNSLPFSKVPRPIFLYPTPSSIILHRSSFILHS
jgi:hypothetical protein